MFLNKTIKKFTIHAQFLTVRAQQKISSFFHAIIADAVNAFATFIREGIVYAYLIWAVLAGTLSVDGFVLMFAAVGGFSVWVAGILTEYANLSRHSLDFCRVREFIDYPDVFTGTENIVHEDGNEYMLELRKCQLPLQRLRYIHT